jgi:hypothetical protein
MWADLVGEEGGEKGSLDRCPSCGKCQVQNDQWIGNVLAAGFVLDPSFDSLGSPEDAEGGWVAR